MALGIVEQVGRTDVGRQRSANEDSLVLQPPFFAVADGMGGARAGEVASAIAAEAFEGASAAGEAAEAQLARILREANRRIYDLAVTDESRRGMGTTLTAAKVHDDEVSLGHVGDSRAYRMRDGELEQITRDHSLVAELERSGQITPEAAEHHPQRSIITRALGPEPDVEVDTYTLSAPRGRPLPALLGRPHLDDLRRRGRGDPAHLGDARRRGGRAHQGRQPERRQGQHHGRAVPAGRGRRRDAAAEPTTVAGPAARPRTRRSPASSAPTRSRPRPRRPPRARRIEPVPPEPAAPRAAGAPQAPPPRRPRAEGPARPGPDRRRARRPVRAQPPGLLRGHERRRARDRLPRRALRAALRRSTSTTEEYASGMPARAIPAGRRERVLDHEWRSREDAVDLVRALERGQLEGAGTASN